MSRMVVPVCHHGNAVHYLMAGTCHTTDYAGYIALRQQHRPGAIFFSDITFPFAADVVFEACLSASWRMENMWRSDLLLYWYWQKKKTGITSVQERLDALSLAARHFNILKGARHRPCSAAGRLL